MAQPAPKMTHKTPKAERQPNPFKAAALHRESVKDTPTLKPADGDARPGPGANGLRPFSRKKWDALKKQGATVHSTFGGTKTHTGERTGLRRRLSPSQGHPERSTPRRLKAGEGALRKLNVHKILKPIGVRGRRLAPGDRKQEAETHIQPCCCGCNAHLRPGVGGVPGKGLISRAHLESRYYELTRNLRKNNYPACLELAHWLDHEDAGVKAKAHLLGMVKKKNDEARKAWPAQGIEDEPDIPLEPEEIQPVLGEFGFYTWLERRYRQD